MQFFSENLLVRCSAGKHRVSRAGGFARSRCWHWKVPAVPCGVAQQGPPHLRICCFPWSLYSFLPEGTDVLSPECPSVLPCTVGLGDPEGFPGDGLVQQLWDLLWQVQEGHFASLRSFQILSRTRGLFRLPDSVSSPSVLFQLPKCLYSSKIDFSPAKFLTTL